MNIENSFPETLLKLIVTLPSHGNPDFCSSSIESPSKVNETFELINLWTYIPSFNTE